MKTQCESSSVKIAYYSCLLTMTTHFSVLCSSLGPPLSCLSHFDNFLSLLSFILSVSLFSLSLCLSLLLSPSHCLLSCLPHSVFSLVSHHLSSFFSPSLYLLSSLFSLTWSFSLLFLCPHLLGSPLSCLFHFVLFSVYASFCHSLSCLPHFVFYSLPHLVLLSLVYLTLFLHSLVYLCPPLS